MLKNLDDTTCGDLFRVGFYEIFQGMNRLAFVNTGVKCTTVGLHKHRIDITELNFVNRDHAQT